MRDYGIVSPKFWTGKTGKALRGKVEAQLVAVYLMTSPHANMIGAYYCPLDYIAKETGLPLEGASKALQSLIEALFCSFDEQTEEVFVHRMAVFQIGERLDPKDNRCKGVAREVERIDSASIKAAFRAIYFEAYHLPGEAPKRPKKTSPLQAPTKPEAGSEAEAGSEDKQPGVRFSDFWSAWPKHERKQDKAKCKEKWIAHDLDAVADSILADVQAKKVTRKWREGFIEAPEVYINNRRWEDGGDLLTEWWTTAGFTDQFEAENAGCRSHNAAQFRDGKRIAEAA